MSALFASERRSCLVDLLDRPDHLPEAIENYLVGPDLLQLVGELEAHSGVAPSTPLPSELLARIRTAGLVGLAPSEFRLVMQQPRVLLQLQKTVLLKYSPYWEEVIERADGRLPPQPVAPARERPWYRSPWAWTANLGSVLAASVALFLLVVQPRFERMTREIRLRVTLFHGVN